MLFWTLVRTDFKSRYQGTLGGFVWALLKPMTLFIVLMSVFSFVFASDPTYKLDLIVGLFLWDFFAEGTKTGLISLHAKGYLLTKARCPSWILVVSSLANAALTLGVFSLVIVAFLGFSGRLPTLAGLGLFVLYCVALAAMVAGFSLATSVLFLRYRDLNQVWDVVIQAGFFVAPIIYPLGILPERFHAYLYRLAPDGDHRVLARRAGERECPDAEGARAARPRRQSRFCWAAFWCFADSTLGRRSTCSARG